MRKPLCGLLTLFAILSLINTSCSKLDGAGDIDEVNWHPEVVTPLVNGTISLQDVLDDLDDISFLEVAGDGNMRLFYEDDPQSQSSDEIIGAFPDFPLVITEAQMSVPFDVIPGVEVDRIELKGGSLAFEINSPYDENIEVTITIPSLMKDGNPFQVTTTATYLGTLPVVARIDPVSVADYTVQTNGNGELELGYQAFRGNGERVAINYISGNGISWEYASIDAIWDQSFFDLKEDAIAIDIFDNWVEGDIQLADPRLTIEVDNSFGFASRLRVNRLQVTTIEGDKIDLESSLLTNGISLAYPALQEKGQSKRTTITFDRNNSNIDEILNARPIRIEYDLVGEINPDGSQTMGFATDNSEIATTVKVDIPVYGSANGFTIENEVDIDLNDFDDIEEAEFKLLTDNAIPADLDLQMYFVGANRQVIDSLFVMPRNLLKAATVDANGMVTQNSQFEDLIDISPSRFDLLRQSEKVQIHASFSTVNDGQQMVRILSTQELNVKLGVKVKVR